MTASFALDGVLMVLPTAFHDDGSIDRDGIAALVEAGVAAGIRGITALGVMGEAAELTEPERHEILEHVLASVAGRVAVVVGISGASPEIVASRAHGVAGAGADAVMVSPAATLGLVASVAAAAGAGLPIVIQDYPAGTGVIVSADDLVAAAAREPLVAGIKAEAPPVTGMIAEVRARCPNLGVVGGLGGLFLMDELRAGATGTMTGFALPERLVSIERRYRTAPDDAEAEWRSLLPLLRFEAFAPFSLAARKEVWRLRGVIGSAYCRRAGARLDQRSRDDVRRAYLAVGGG